MSCTTVVEVGEVTLGDFALRAGFGLVVGVLETWVFRAGNGCGGVVGAFCTEYHLL